MSLTITTPDAEALRKDIWERLDQQAIERWESDGESFTLTDPEWGGKVWVRAFTEPGQLLLGLVPAEAGVMAEGVYAVYCGRLVELLLQHFRGKVSAVQVTGAVTYPDLMHWTGESQHAPRAEGQ
jgi:hypothetical protein